MKFVPNARTILRKAWSMWGVFALAIVNGVVASLPAFQDLMSPWRFMAANVAGLALIALLRVLDQGIGDGE